MEHKNTINFKNLLVYGVICAVSVFFIRTLITRWDAVRAYEFTLHYPSMIMSVLLLGISMLLMPIVWRSIIHSFQQDKKVAASIVIKAFVYSQFGRYLPGKVWQYAGQAYIARAGGVGADILAVSIVYEIMLSTIAALTFSLILLALTASLLVSQYIYVILFVNAIGLIFLRPRTFYPLVNYCLRRLKRSTIPSQYFLRVSSIVKILVYYAGVYGIAGVGFFFLARAVTQLPYEALVGSVGAYTLATVVGTIAIILPAGLGVRESIIVVFLQGFMPLSVSIAVSLIARLWNIAVEVLLFLLIYVRNFWIYSRRGT